MKKLGVLVVCLSIVFMVSSFPAYAADPMKLKFGHIAPPFHGQSKGIDAFAEYVKDKTNGAIEIKTFPFGQLGSETSLTEQVQSGTLDMASITTAVLQNYVPEVAVVDLPFVFPSREAAYATLDDPEVQEKLFGFLPKKGFVGIGWTENEFRDITNSKREIRKPEDLKGLKIRVMKSPIYIDTFKALGASPTDLPFPEIYSALQNGTIDAQENPLLTSILIKATEITKFVTDTDHILTECVIIVTPELWDKLTPEQKQIFRDAAKTAIKVNREENAKLMTSLPKSGISVEQYCKENNVKVTTLTPEERQAFKDAMKSVWATYREKIGPDVFDFFIKKVDSHSGK
ncbi:MAG: DctP family TRAP transporter solute-binding subunit [Desulfomonilaceae bacterium]|nr:DctP family TRAP transporter solute-binding subunit [Desulfomonilaceae bacterium]